MSGRRSSMRMSITLSASEAFGRQVRGAFGELVKARSGRLTTVGEECWLSWGVANWRGCFEASANAGGAPMVGLRCRLVAVASPAYVLLRLLLADASRPRSHSKPRSMWTVSASVVGRYQGTVCLKEYLFILYIYIYIDIHILYINPLLPIRLSRSAHTDNHKESKSPPPASEALPPFP